MSPTSPSTPDPAHLERGRDARPAAREQPARGRHCGRETDTRTLRRIVHGDREDATDEVAALVGTDGDDNANREGTGEQLAEKERPDSDVQQMLGRRGAQ
jgi:hypothetical protein